MIDRLSRLVRELRRDSQIYYGNEGFPHDATSYKLSVSYKKRNEYDFRPFSASSYLVGPDVPPILDDMEITHRDEGMDISQDEEKIGYMVVNQMKREIESNRRAKPIWHPKWNLMRVISGHLGWVRSVDVDVSNEWFATGSCDRTIKIWDLASGRLKLTLTGHISPVRCVRISERHPYLFSAGEDKQVKCWDLQQNRIIRHYHGHLHGVYTLSIHPSLDVIATGGRDAVVRVWDMRSRVSIFSLSGHTSTISSVECQSAHPQILSASHDSTIRLWDLRKGNTFVTLTHHKKSVRTLLVHPSEFLFASASSDYIKKFAFPEGRFLDNMSGHNSIVNTLTINEDNVMVSGSDNGQICFWDWKSGTCFQKLNSAPQPGSMSSEAGIFASKFDKTGIRLITCEADKSIKIWKEE